MPFYEELTRATASDRDLLVNTPVIQRALRGQIDRATYVAFLTQAYHHVRHTAPLLMAVGARLPAHQEWLRQEVVHYVEEELGHEQWILNDIEAAGGDRLSAARSSPAPATDAMVAYAWDTVMRRHPVGFFGMVFVLEGTSVALALRAAEQIQASLELPARAMTYLRSHGQLDQQHVHHLASILNRFEDAGDREAVLTCAHAMFWLYGSVFRSLEQTPGIALRKTA
jgi:pyrroloquinoline quinone (PQQ) biosynthesis protein C